MNEYKPQTGDRVRVVLEGVACEVNPRGFGIGPELGLSENYISYKDPHVVSIERLPDPEPEWQVGDVVIDDEREIYQRCKFKDGWWAMGMQGDVKFQRPIRPLTLLVRDGKPVQP